MSFFVVKLIFLFDFMHLHDCFERRTNSIEHKIHEKNIKYKN